MRISPIVAFGLAAAALGTLVVALNWLFPGALAQSGGAPRLIYPVTLLTLLIASAVLGRRSIDLKDSVRNGLIWVVILAALVMVYSLREEFMGLGNRMSEALVPSMPVAGEDGAVTLRRAQNGHFTARAQVTGPNLDEASLLFLVDTGASRVALPASEARRLGIDTAALTYSLPIQTANGTRMAAPVRLNRIEIGGIVVHDVAATVADGGLESPLLGMSFLDRLSGYRVEGDQLILYPAGRPF